MSRELRRVIAYLAALVVASGGAVAAGVLVADRQDGRAAPAEPGGTRVVVRPPPGQAFLSGEAERVAADGAQAPAVRSPFTLTAVERGVGRATIENALVDGRRSTISWGGGTPLPVTGDGGVDLAGARIEVDRSGVTWTVGGASRHLLPGRYRAGAPVAVGSQGLGGSRDAVEFTADERTVLNATAGVVVKLPPQPMELTGPGSVSVSGRLSVVEATGSRRATSVELKSGPYRVTLTPGPAAVRVEATLQGPLTTS